MDYFFINTAPFSMALILNTMKVNIGTIRSS